MCSQSKMSSGEAELQRCTSSEKQSLSGKHNKIWNHVRVIMLRNTAGLQSKHHFWDQCTKTAGLRALLKAQASSSRKNGTCVAQRWVKWLLRTSKQSGKSPTGDKRGVNIQLKLIWVSSFAPFRVFSNLTQSEYSSCFINANLTTAVSSLQSSVTAV